MSRHQQVWPMPDAHDDRESFRLRACLHVHDRSSALFDWACWANTAAPVEVVDHHLAVASTLDPSLSDLDLEQPLGQWSATAWDRLWSSGGHEAWADVCRRVRGDQGGAAADSLRVALIETTRIDALSVILYRLRYWDSEWASDTLARRVERVGDQIIELGRESGVDVESAATSPTQVRLFVREQAHASDRLIGQVQALVGVPASVVPSRRAAPVT